MGNGDFIDEAIRRLMTEPDGLLSVLESLQRFPADVAVRLIRDLDPDVSADFLEAMLFWPEATVHRAAVRALEGRRSVRDLLALEHCAQVAPEWTPAGAAAERLQALGSRGELAAWSAPLSFWRAFWSLPDHAGASDLILSARDAGGGGRLVVVKLQSDGTLGEARSHSLTGPPQDRWEHDQLLPITAAQARAFLLEGERETLRRRGTLPLTLLAYQAIRWSSAPPSAPQLDGFTRELRELVPFRAVYSSDHDCADCAALNGKRMTVLEPVDQDPLCGIACRVSVGNAEELAPLANLQVGTRHPARRLLERYGHWAREHLMG